MSFAAAKHEYLPLEIAANRANLCTVFVGFVQFAGPLRSSTDFPKLPSKGNKGFSGHFDELFKSRLEFLT